MHSLVSSPPEAEQRAASAEDEERAPLLSDFHRRQFRNDSSFRSDESFRSSARRGAPGRFLGDADESGHPVAEPLARCGSLPRQQAAAVAAKVRLTSATATPKPQAFAFARNHMRSPYE